MCLPCCCELVTVTTVFIVKNGIIFKHVIKLFQVRVFHDRIRLVCAKMLVVKMKEGYVYDNDVVLRVVNEALIKNRVKKGENCADTAKDCDCDSLLTACV